MRRRSIAPKDNSVANDNSTSSSSTGSPSRKIKHLNSDPEFSTTGVTPNNLKHAEEVDPSAKCPHILGDDASWYATYL